MSSDDKEPELESDPSRLVTLGEAIAIAAGARLLAAHRMPPLEKEDVFGLCMLALAPSIRFKLAARNKPVDNRVSVHAERLALQFVSWQRPDLAGAAFKADLENPPLDLGDRVTAWWEQWRMLVHDSVAAAELANWDATLATRQGVLAMTWKSIASADASTKPEILLKDLSYGLQAAHQPPQSPAELAATYRLLNKNKGGGLDLAYVDEKGQIRLGKRQIRDRLEAERSHVDRWQRTSGEGADETAVADPVDNLAQQEEEFATIDAIRSIIEARLATAKEGSSRRLVLENFVSLAMGDILAKDLALEAGLSAAAISDAFAAERKAIRAAARQRGGG